jgi:uncharacterized membrane protein (DUF106 family)
MAFLDPVLNPILGPLLNWSPFWGIFVLSLVISLVITLTYKFFTNQTEMKRLKDEQKEFQKRMKELKEHPQEMMKIQKEAMSKNFEYMKHSFKPTLITMLPIILIFGWMNAHLAFEPIYPGETYSVTAMFNEGVVGATELLLDDGSNFAVDINTGVKSVAKHDIEDNQATWYLASDAGGHLITTKFNEIEQSKKVLITTNLEYEPPFQVYEESPIKKIQINYKKLRPMGGTSLFGWQPGWLGLYIILSIVFSIALRKVMKIY